MEQFFFYWFVDRLIIIRVRCSNNLYRSDSEIHKTTALRLHPNVRRKQFQNEFLMTRLDIGGGNAFSSCNFASAKFHGYIPHQEAPDNFENSVGWTLVRKFSSSSGVDDEEPEGLIDTRGGTILIDRKFRSNN